LNEIEPDFINSCRTATGQNVAFVNLNGALDINKPRKRGFFALKKGFKSPVMHQQKIAIGWRRALTPVGASLLAKNVNDNAYFLNQRGACAFFASKN
jgi:hypothetical protein